MSPLVVGITGSTGILGRRLLARLSEAGTHKYQLRCLVRSERKLGALRSQVEVVEGDLANRDALAKFVRRVDVCIHLASEVSHTASREQYYATNVAGTENLCRALVEDSPTARLVHCSSITVLRRSARFPWLSTEYANSKHSADQQVRAYCQQHGLRATLVYPGLIYGPEDTNLVPSIVRHLRTQRLFFVSGGERNCPVIYIDDLCELFQFIVDDSSTVGESFVGVGPQEAGVHDFIRQIAKLSGSEAPSRKLPRSLLLPVVALGEALVRGFGLKQSLPISMRTVNFLSATLDPRSVAARNRRRWKPRTPMADGVPQALAWCRENALI